MEVGLFGGGGEYLQHDVVVVIVRGFEKQGEVGFF